MYFTGTFNNLNSILAGHFFNAHAIGKEFRDQPLKLGNTSQVFLPDGKNKPALHIRINNCLNYLDKFFPFFPVAKYKQLLKLVKNQIDRLEMIKIN
ncbi:hypothetical protein ES708_33291 [subsurface metagenome]